MTSNSFTFKFGEVTVHEREFSLVKAGDVLAVEPKAFRVLLILLRNPRKLIPKEELLNAVWGDASVTENSLTRAIALLRRLLGDDAREPRFIETVTSVGYRWLCPVEQVADLRAATAASGAGPLEGPDAVQGPALSTTASRSSMRISSVLAAGAILLTGVIWYFQRPFASLRITAYSQITHDGSSKFLGGTDGSRLYFTEDSPNNFEQVAINGGVTARLPIEIPGTFLYVRDVSPDGSRVLINTRGEGSLGDSIWVSSVLGGAGRRLDSAEPSGAFSPDGKWVVYSNAEGDIFRIQVDGGGKRKLANAGTGAGAFSWSPDGKRIRFTKDRQLWEMSADGTGIHPLLPDWKGPGAQGSGNWTPDGRFYLFVVYDQYWESSGGQIWALDERRSRLRQRSPVPIQLTNGPIAWDRLTPDKKGKIIFAQGVQARGELSRIDPMTGHPSAILGGISAEFAAYSPDGESVAYVAFPEGTLWRARRDGSDSIQLSQPPGQVINPRWSPDSKEIAFTTASLDGHSSIHRISAADGAPLWLLSDPTKDMSDASWSPDGKKIVFAFGDGFSPGTSERDLRIVDLETRQVTIVPGSEGKWSPRWSPDGRYLVAQVSFSAPRLAIFDFRIARWRMLETGFDTAFPAFSHDSRFIYFLSGGQDQGIFRVPVDGGKVERTVDTQGLHFIGYFGSSMTLDPTDAPLVTRDTGSCELYALTLEEK